MLVYNYYNQQILGYYKQSGCLNCQYFKISNTYYFKDPIILSWCFNN